MASKQEPRPAYHRRNDLKRLQEHASHTPLLISDNGRAYEARLRSEDAPFIAGRYEVVHAYIAGWYDGQRSRARDTTSDAAMRAMTEGNFR